MPAAAPSTRLRRWLPLGGAAVLLAAALLAVPACVESRPDAAPRAVSAARPAGRRRAGQPSSSSARLAQRGAHHLAGCAARPVLDERAAGAARHRHRLRLGRRRPRGDQFPRHPGCQRRQGDAGRPEQLRRRAGGRLSRPRPGGAAHRGAQGQAAADRHGQQPRPDRRPARLCHRQPLRPGPDADHRHRQRAQPRDRVLQQPHHPRRDPDRRRHQPRQFRRPAARLGRAADRRQHPDRQPQRRQRRHRLCHTGRRGQPHRAAADPRRPLRAPGHRHQRRPAGPAAGAEAAQGRDAWSTSAAAARPSAPACSPSAAASAARSCQATSSPPSTTSR
jgi:hypothetical protein